MLENREATDEFEAARPVLTGLAYRILGSLAEAEDVVQDVFLAWMDADRAAISRPRSWLMTVCTRKAVDALRSARLARTSYVGAWLPEPVQTHYFDSPEADETSAESLTTAFLLVLERLAPKERAAFLLRDVFALTYEEIGASLGIGTAACRKLVSRARANVRRDAGASRAPRERQDELVAAFAHAIKTGETGTLAALLARDVTLSADSGGKVVGIRKTLEGAAAVLAFVGRTLSGAWRAGEISVAELNSGRALVVREEGRPFAVVTFACDADGNASRIYIMRNPDKLARIDPPM